MDTMEKGWEENREDYLKKAYGAVRSKGEPIPLNEAVDRWEMLTEDASKHYLWRALGLFRVNGDLELEEDSGQKMLDIDPSVSMAELIEEELELEPGEGENVRKVEKDDYRKFGGFDAPAVPLFIPWEHVERHEYEIFPHESPGTRGFAAKEETSSGTEETWLGFYNHDGKEEGSTWINQVFRGMEVEGEEGFFSTEDVFTDRNRESYTDTIWESEPLKIRQRAYQVWDAAVEAVEEELPARLEEYEDRWEKEAGELDALKREFRLMTGDEEYDEENPTYIEQIVHDYYEEGLHRDSKLLQPFLENIESTPYEEGDMNLDEATRGSPTSEGRKQRNQEYMSHYLDLVWQLSQEKYGEE
jgi:hypothetical protein